MATAVNLPEGFVLDAPQMNPSALPEGFVLEQPKSAAPVAPDRSTLEKLGAAMGQLQQGAMFNLGDVANAAFDASTGYTAQQLANLVGAEETAAAMGGGVPNRSWREFYDRALKQERATLEEFQKANPELSLGLNIAGGIANPIGRGAMATTAAGKIGTGAALGAGLGAAYGFGAGRGEEERFAGAAMGAPVGAVLGGAVPAAGVVASKVAPGVIGMTSGLGSNLLGRIGRSVQKGNASAVAEGMSGKVSPIQLADKAQQAVQNARNVRNTAYRTAQEGFEDLRAPGKDILESMRKNLDASDYQNLQPTSTTRGLIDYVEGQIKNFGGTGKIIKRGEMTPMTIGSFDKIKQRIRNFNTGDDTVAQQLQKDLVASIDKPLRSVNQQYAKANDAYGIASDRINKVTQEFGMKEEYGKLVGNKDDIAKRIIDAAKAPNNSDTFRTLQKLGGMSGDAKLVSTAEGMAAAPLTKKSTPARLLFAGLSLAGAGAGRPETLLALPFMSPQFAGRAALGYGRVNEIATKLGISPDVLIKAGVLGAPTEEIVEQTKRY